MKRFDPNRHSIQFADDYSVGRRNRRSTRKETETALQVRSNESLAGACHPACRSGAARWWAHRRRAAACVLLMVARKYEQLRLVDRFLFRDDICRHLGPTGRPRALRTGRDIRARVLLDFGSGQSADAPPPPILWTLASMMDGDTVWASSAEGRRLTVRGGRPLRHGAPSSWGPSRRGRRRRGRARWS